MPATPAAAAGTATDDDDAMASIVEHRDRELLAAQSDAGVARVEQAFLTTCLLCRLWPRAQPSTTTISMRWQASWSIAIANCWPQHPAQGCSRPGGPWLRIDVVRSPSSIIVFFLAIYLYEAASAEMAARRGTLRRGGRLGRRKVMEEYEQEHQFDKTVNEFKNMSNFERWKEHIRSKAGKKLRGSGEMRWSPALCALVAGSVLSGRRLCARWSPPLCALERPSRRRIEPAGKHRAAPASIEQRRQASSSSRNLRLAAMQDVSCPLPTTANPAAPAFPPGFPATPLALTALPGAALQGLLLAYGQPAPPLHAARRLQLAAFAGVGHLVVV